MTYEQFSEALKAFCLSNGYEIAGTCGAEGIYGEISVRRVGEPTKWQEWEAHAFNFEKDE